jgi:hypothetical protein
MTRFILPCLLATLGSAMLLAQPAEAAVEPDSIVVTARALSGEKAVGPPSRVARRPSTDLYVQYLADRLAAILVPLGGTVELQSFDPGIEDSPPDSVRRTFANVIGLLPGALGSESPGTFVIGAHLDATSSRDEQTDPSWDYLAGDAPGADDNGSGIAAILEALRVMSETGIRPQADLLVAFFDGEEVQYAYDPDTGGYEPTDRLLLGSTFFAEGLTRELAARGESLYGFVNLDMVAYNEVGDELVVLTNLTSRWLANDLLEVHQDGAAPGLALSRIVKGLTFSDHAPFWELGQDAVLLIEAVDIQNHATDHYHRAADRVDFSYSRNGSQAAKAAELLVGMLGAWSDTGDARLTVTGEDILVHKGIALDVSTADVGDSLEVRVGVTNRGGTRRDPFTVELEVRDLDHRFLRRVASEDPPQLLPAGGRVRVEFPWIPASSERGAVRLEAVVKQGGEELSRGSRILAIEGDPAQAARVFVYPNPTRDPSSARISYTLTQPGAVRFSVIDLRGRTVGTVDLPYDPVLPGAGTTAGLAELPLNRVPETTDLAPGLYLVRVELFPGGSSATTYTAISKFAVVR